MFIISLNKAQKLFKLFNESNEEEPICVICNYHCPYSTYEDGQYCENENPDSYCFSSFLDWLKTERK